MRLGKFTLWLFVMACGRTGLHQTTIVADPIALDFGQVFLGSTASLTFSVSASGLTTDQVTIVGSQSGPFNWSGLHFVIAPHQTIDIPVTFAPSELGEAHATLHIAWGTGGQDIELSGIGSPFPCLGDTPDGTPCQLWWEPCVIGATCQGGLCRSKIAESEIPGDLRWTFPAKNVTPLVVDDLGASYSLLTPGVLALDACGRARWQTTKEYDSLLLGGETLVASTAKGQIEGLSRRDGSVLWSADVGQVLGCGSSCTSLRVQRPVLTNQGSLLVYASTLDVGLTRPALIDLGLDGGLQWIASFGTAPKGFAIGSVVADSSGNTYLATYVDGQLGALLSYDPLGAPRFRQTEPQDPGALALSPSALIGSGVAWSLDGMALSEIPSPTGLGNGWCGDIGSAAADGTLYCFTQKVSPDAVMAVRTIGSPLWVSSLAPGLNAVSNLTLGEPHELFLVAGAVNGAGAGGTLIALDASDGGVLWTVQPFQSAVSAGHILSLSPTATLIAADGLGLYGVFAGLVRPSPSASWSRSGGDGTNRNCPPSTSTQSPE